MKVIIAKNYKELSSEAAMIFLNKLTLKSDSVFGFATGSTPIGMYKKIIEDTKNYSYNWSNIKTFNLDEYVGLEKDSSQSYLSYMRKNLFDSLNIKEKNIHFPKDYNPLEYEKSIKDNPIDIQLLGIGSNGHIGFNEPGSDIKSITRKVKLSESTISDNSRFFKKEEVPNEAVTMGVDTIMRSKKIVLIATGKNKAEAIRQMIEGRVSKKCPASFLQKHPNVTVIIDKDAASLLEEEYNGVNKNGWTDVRLLNKTVVPNNKNILVISPHHDDSAVSCGATIHAFNKNNNITTVVMTGGYHAHIEGKTKTEKIKIRNEEAKKESDILGHNLIFSKHHFYDNNKKHWKKDLKILDKVYCRVNPDIIILPHTYDEHPNHRLSTELVFDYLREKKIKGVELWHYEGIWSQHILDKINVIFAFNQGLMDIKNRAIKQHKSQISRLPLIEASNALNQFRAKSIPEQKFAGFGQKLPNILDYTEVYFKEEF